MAGIDKTSQLSGKFHGGKMYVWSKDFIKISPDEHKYFKDKKAILWFFPYASYFCIDIIDIHFFIGKYSFPKLWKKDYWNWKKFGAFFAIQPPMWEYYLYVPELKTDEFDGIFWHQTYNPYLTARKLDKLVGDMKIVSPTGYSKDSWMEQYSDFEYLEECLEKEYNYYFREETEK